MQSLDVARKVQSDGVQLFRPTKNKPGEYDVKDVFSGNKRGWVALDAFSASAILTVYEALKPEQQAKYATLSPQRQAQIAWKYVK